MNEIFREIPNACTWDIVEPINKGWSKDKKYYIKAIDGRELLLRMANISQYDNKKQEFEAVKQLDTMDALMSRPIDFGICNAGESVYSLFTWVEGDDANDVISTLSTREQYKLGVQAGEYLRQMHQFPAVNNRMPWAERYNPKIDKYISNYKACGTELKGADKIIDFIEQNRYLLDNRFQSFQHGDYHVGNMIVTKSGELGIIDFNRFDTGDPWEEFNRITWCASQSVFFASGRINGYFANEAPDLFFRLMALYIASNLLSSIHWSIPFGQVEVDMMVKRAENVLRWYDEFQTYIPNWYLPDYKE